MTGVVQLTTTWPDEASAERAARLAVEEGLAACAQVHGPITSIYRWNGEIERGAEWYCHFKTSTERLEPLMARVRSAHPYEVPELIATPVVAGDPAYIDWVRSGPPAT